MSEQKSFEDRIDKVNELIQSNHFIEALQAVRAVKEEMLRSSPCDPSHLGWILFFEFKCLHGLGEYEQALDQAQETLPVIYTLTAGNAAFRASVCSELCVRCAKPVAKIIAFGEEAFKERSRGGNPIYALQSLQTSCNLLELRDAEDKAQGFARQMIKLGAEHQADVPVIKGFLVLLRGALRGGRDSDLRPLVDELLSVLKPLPESEQRADLMEQVSTLESSKSPLATNQPRLERFLQG